MVESTNSLTLPPDPASASRARAFVGRVLASTGFDELVDTAQLLVSEVVTNSVLHAASEIELACWLEPQSFLVEVRDHSPITPTVRHPSKDAATGRGLGLVELLATTWGINADDSGKTVWFQLGAETTFAFSALAASKTATAAGPATFSVALPNLPVALTAAVIEHGDALVRELALAAIGSDTDDRNRTVWHAPGIDLGPLLTALESARREGRTTIDAAIDLPLSCGPAALTRLGMIDEADQQARAGGLLAIAAIPELGALRRWLLSQIALQAEGATPLPWTLPAPTEPLLVAGRLAPERTTEFDLLVDAVVVADDTNRIIYVNAAAEDLLGWPEGELVGHRLIVIIPLELREAHLAGFARYLLTGEAHLIGSQPQVPALRHDDTTVEVLMTLLPIDLGDGRRGFHATLERSRRAH